MKSFRRVAYAVLFAVSSWSCGNSNRIPAGVYWDSSGIESIAVTEEGMNLRLWHKRSDGEEGLVTDGTYPYKLDDRGGIRLIGSSNDCFYLSEVYEFDWSFHGRDIIREHRWRSERSVFTKSDDKDR